MERKVITQIYDLLGYINNVVIKYLKKVHILYFNTDLADNINKNFTEIIRLIEYIPSDNARILSGETYQYIKTKFFDENNIIKRQYDLLFKLYDSLKLQKHEDIYYALFGFIKEIERSLLHIKNEIESM